MKLREILDMIQRTAELNKLSTPLIVGGLVRDRVRGITKEINDIDLTSMNGDSSDLAYACAKVIPHNTLQLYDDGHLSMKLNSLQIDFSNHFIIPEIDEELDRLGIKQKTPLTREMYSRDFTINTLLQDLNFESVYDITGKGVQDIRTHIIRCPINPELTIKHDPKRIIRSLYFAVRFDYTLDADLVKAIKKYRHLLKDASDEYVKDKANKLIKLNPEKAIDLLIQLDLLTVIPMTKTISDELIKNKMLYYAFAPATNKGV